MKTIIKFFVSKGWIDSSIKVNLIKADKESIETYTDEEKEKRNSIESRKEYINNASVRLSGGVLPNIKQWMINRYFQIDKEWAARERENWQWVILNLSKLSPSNVEFQFESIERDLEPKFKVNDKICFLEELSSGFQSILSIVLGIFEWVEKINDGKDVLVKNARGTVIIDELDVHLHPE